MLLWSLLQHCFHPTFSASWIKNLEIWKIPFPMNRPQQLDLEPPHHLGFLQRTSAVDSEPELFCYNFCDCDVTTYRYLCWKISATIFVKMLKSILVCRHNLDMNLKSESCSCDIYPVYFIYLWNIIDVTHDGGSEATWTLRLDTRSEAIVLTWASEVACSCFNNFFTQFNCILSFPRNCNCQIFFVHFLR